MTEDPVILAVDLGTSSMKVALITVSGNVLGWESEPVNLILSSEGGAEQSPEEWWQAFLTTSRRLIAKGLVPPSKIQAICCSTQGRAPSPWTGRANH